MQAAGYKGYNYCDMLAENKEQAARIMAGRPAKPALSFRFDQGCLSRYACL